MPSPYIARATATEFLARFAAAFDAPKDKPALFYIRGIGGIGKSTLLTKLQTEHEARSGQAAKVTFGRTEKIDEPIPLMKALYEQLAPRDSWSSDVFWQRYDQYFETINALETQPASRFGSVDETQKQHVKTLLRGGVDVFGKLFMSERQERLAEQVADRGLDLAVAGLSLKDEVVALLNQHRATKNNAALQRLMLNPLSELTQAFVEGLGSQGKPIALVLDTYEKVPTVVNTWLWRTLLGNTSLRDYPMRLTLGGRYDIQKQEGWRKLHQDTGCLYERAFRRFSREQTKDYLGQIGITDEQDTEDIYRVTKGLPYYLNWIREQKEKGQPLNIAAGNEAIERLLLEGLNIEQTRVVYVAACCRWFDQPLLRHLVEAQGLDFATAADESRNCYGWLIEQSFVERVERRFRIDDVARGIFRTALRQAEPERFEQVHQQLAGYFLQASNREAPAEALLTEKYNNPDWRSTRSEYLYHLPFARHPDFQTQCITHLLEARFFNQDELLQTPVSAMQAEGALDEKSDYIAYGNRKFLTDILPAVFLGWAVLEEIPIDYGYNEVNYGLSAAATQTAIERLLAAPEQLGGLAKFMAYLCKARRCVSVQQQGWIEKARAQVDTLESAYPPDFWVTIYCWKLGNSCADLSLLKEAIACYDAALAIKPDKHEALYNKGNALSALGRKEEAIACYDAALAIKPDLHEALYNKACCYALQENLTEAITWLEQAIDLSSEYAAMAKTDSDFDLIRSHPQFQALLNSTPTP